jgi:hypothetical protein
LFSFNSAIIDLYDSTDTAIIISKLVTIGH